MVSRVRMTYRQGSPREGSSRDMSIAERRLGVDALSTGGDLLSHLESLVGRSAIWPTQCHVPHCHEGQICWTFLSKCLSHKHSLSLFPGRTGLATGYVLTDEGYLTGSRHDGVSPTQP